MSTRPLLSDSSSSSSSIHVAETVDENVALRKELRELREEFDDFREAIERDREKLGALLHGLRSLFGGAAVESTASSTAVSTGMPINPKWEALKRAFPGRCAELIDTLIAHGPLRISQLSAIMRSDPRTISVLIYKLNKAGGLEKNNGVISLK